MVHRKPKLTLGACCTVHALHDGLVDMLYALLPLLREAFGLSYAEVALIRAANKAAMAMFQIPAGMLAERLGERNLLAFGTFVAGLGFIGLGFSTGFVSLLVFIFLAGIGAAVQHPLSSSLITGAYPGTGRRAALGTFNSLGDVGKFLFMGLAILATGLGFSWQGPVVSYGAVALIIAAGLLILLRAAGAGDRPPWHEAHHAAKSKGWGVRHRQGFLSLGAIAALDTSTRNGFLTFVAFLMIEKGVPTEWAAAAVLITLAGGMCGKFACGILAERVGIARTIAITEIATGGGILLVIAAPQIYAFFLLPLLGVFLNGTSSAIYGSVGELIEDDRHSRAFGLMYTLGSICGLFAPLAYGLLADHAGVATTMAVIGCVVLLTLPLCLVLGPALVHTGTAKPAE
jgi:FSR family fosmidomycin resistance protein-like MFS transporter